MATPKWCCGFECGVSGSNGEHWVFGAAASFSTSTVKSGSRSLRINPTAATTGKATSVQFVTATNKWVIRGYVRFATLPNADVGILTINESGNDGSGAWFKTSDSKIYAKSGPSGSFGATGIAVTTGVWYRIDVNVDISANPWLVDVSIDGTACGQATRAVAATTSIGIVCGSVVNNTSDFFIDDILVSNTLADYPLGGGYVNHFIPTSDGTHSGITSADYRRTLTATDILNSTTDAYQLIDDVPLESGASVDWINMIAPAANSYVECVFGPASGISTPTVAPRAVEVIAGIHQSGTGTGTMILQLNDNGSVGTIYSASGVAGVTSVAYKRAHFADPPSAASAWTLSGNGNFNNVRVRFGPTGTVDANPDQYFDCIMIEAEFADSNVTQDKTQTGVARITATTDKTQTGKSAIRVTTDKTQTGVARIRKVADVTQTGVARIQKVVDQAQTGKANIRNTTDRTQAGVARIRTTVDTNQTGVARIKKVVDVTQTGVADIRATTDRTQAGVARIQKTVDVTQSGKANIVATTLQTQSGVARITATVDQNQPGVANVRNTTDRTQSGVARIRTTSDVTQTGKARIQTVTDSNQTGVSRIQKVTDNTLTGKARITAAADQTQPGTGNIRNTTDQTQTGVANIIVTGTVIQTILGKAAIQNTADQTNTGVARIQMQSDVTNTGKSRIQKIVDNTQTGTARIRVTTDQNQTGVSRIGNIIDVIQSGTARIQVIVDNNITGVANITPAGVNQTITGVAAIQKTVDQVITGVAFIIKSYYPIICDDTSVIFEKETDCSVTEIEKEDVCQKIELTKETECTTTIIEKENNCSQTIINHEL